MTIPEHPLHDQPEQHHMKLKWAVSVLILIGAACSPGARADVEYASASEIFEALNAAGFGCGNAEEYPVDENDPLGGVTSTIQCQWVPTAENPQPPFDLVVFQVFESEEARIPYLVGSLAFGCGVDPDHPLSQAYVHGATWWLASGYGDTDLSYMEQVSEAIGGTANLVFCGPLLEFSREAFDSAYENGDIERMRAVLGEEKSEYITKRG